MPGTIGPIPIPEAGQKQTGYFTFEADPLLAKYQWPFFSIAGARPGPKFLVTAGIHAAEYPAIVSAILLGRKLDPAEVSGTIVIIPLLNRPGFYERSVYVNPEDNDNLNRVFPGSPDGPWSERFAHYFLNEIIARFDYAIDLHGGDMVEDIVPFVIYRGQADPEVERMLTAYGMDWVVKGSISGERPGMLASAANTRGVRAFVAESGRCGLLEEDATARHVNGLENVLRELGILSGQPLRLPPPRVMSRFEWLRTQEEGIFLSTVKVNEWVREGQSLGQMVDLLGNPLSDVKSTVDGLILFIVTSPAIKKGGLLMGIGVPE